ncbi:isoprenyl transferase [Nitrospira sp.]|nr:isoprenyl transferase [Nitrospira sp.]
MANIAPAASISDQDLLAGLNAETLPRHVAVIMDGNGRWARARGLPRIAGHREGINSLKEVLDVFLDLGIPALTIYAFSQENWNRPASEVTALMGLLEQYLSNEQHQLVKRGIRLRTIGRLELLPKSALERIRATERDTYPCTRLNLTVGLSYGGRSEIVEATRQIAQDVQAGRLRPEQLDEATFHRYLSTSELPDPDLLIRTSGESRISNFLLWQLAYTELYFTPTLWPDFRRRETLLALHEFQGRDRRFGRVAPAISPSNGR